MPCREQTRLPRCLGGRFASEPQGVLHDECAVEAGLHAREKVGKVRWQSPGVCCQCMHDLQRELLCWPTQVD
eukprot:1260107-Amphidinium_carterae.3